MTIVEGGWGVPPRLRVVCTGNGGHKECTLATFTIGGALGILAPSPGIVHQVSDPSYSTVNDTAGNIAWRFFRCRKCPEDRGESPYREAEFAIAMEHCAAELADTPSGLWSLDISTKPATLRSSI